jgi:hypothetical protein
LISAGKMVSSGKIHLDNYKSNYSKNILRVFRNKDFIRIVVPGFILFTIIHFNSDVLKSVLTALSFDPYSIKKIIHYLLPFKVSFFFLSVCFLAYPLKNDLHRIIREIKLKDVWPPVIACIILQMAFWNFMPMSMGYGYAEMSVHPFDMPIGWYYKRLLMPALAYIFGFRDIHLYFIFSMLISFLLTLAVWQTIKKQLPGVSFPLRLLIFFSVCSLEFVSYHFFFPGYVDSLLSILILLIYFYDFPDTSKVILFVLALATHELSVFLFLPFIAFRCPPVHKMICAVVIFLYCVLYLASYNFKIHDLFLVHRVGGYTILQWIKGNWLIFLCGVLISFKLFWIFLFYGIKESNPAQKNVLTGILLSGFSCCFLGVDTSRLMAFAFPALLFSIPVVINKIPRYLFIAIMAVNTIIPYITVSLNLGYIKVTYFKDFIHWLSIL